MAVLINFPKSKILTEMIIKLNSKKRNNFPEPNPAAAQGKPHSPSVKPEPQKRQKIHPAIQYFHRLQGSNRSLSLRKTLASYQDPKEVNPETFAIGVKQFIQLANSNVFDNQSENSRTKLYGNSFSGLHYHTDLVQLWNASHSEQDSIQPSHVVKFAPSPWSHVIQNGFSTLVYKGHQPAEALDRLITGPSVIDCGMYCQLSILFGIRYMLGNEQFNACFGHTPLFITQSLYNNIADSTQPYSGNPLYSFLSRPDQNKRPGSISVKHLANSPLYPLKHPGGNYSGENCVIIDGKHYVFDPRLGDTQGLSEPAVLNLLHEAFNEDRAPYDTERLSLYRENPDKIHPLFGKTYGQLALEADGLMEAKLTKEEFLDMEQNSSLELEFDLDKFAHWLQKMRMPSLDGLDYLPLDIDSSTLPEEFLSLIPFENRMTMDFSTFKQTTAEQQKLIQASKQFCQSVMEKKSRLEILSGKAGVGKTASAVCAAKELIARGKNVVWISEVMVKGWADLAKSEEAIDKLLNTNPDAVFLDDDNLSGHSGRMLLEKIVAWYAANEGKGVFITSNEHITFKNCYGYKLDGNYHYPPFIDYCSPQYSSWQHKTGLSGESLRKRRAGQSIGAIVSQEAWLTNESKLGSVELIPSFDESNEVVPIRRSLHATGFIGEVFTKLRPIQQRWLKVHQTGNYSEYYHGKYHHVRSHLTANRKKFEETHCRTIALEIRENYNSAWKRKEIDTYSIDELVRVLNYAHDQGGKRVILINQTSYSPEELLAQIKKQLPESEKERTWSRFMLLLCETEESIFTHKDFVRENESIQKVHLKPHPLAVAHSGRNTQNLFSGPMVLASSKVKATLLVLN